MGTRLVAPDDAIMQTSVEGARLGTEVIYGKGRDGTVDVDNKQHIKALKSLGYRLPFGRPVASPGRECISCGFHGFFTTCGRCGGTCE